MAENKYNWKTLVFLLLVVLGVSTCTAIQGFRDTQHAAGFGIWLIAVAGLGGGFFAARAIIKSKPTKGRLILGIIVGVAIAAIAAAFAESDYVFYIGFIAMIALSAVITFYIVSSFID